MKAIFQNVLLVAGFILLAAAGLMCFYVFYISPGFNPMRDHDLAWNYSNVLSQVELQDLSALSISPPDTLTNLSQADIRRILQRLHDTDHFPEWKPEFNLMDSEGKPLEFSMEPRGRASRSVSFSGTRR